LRAFELLSLPVSATPAEVKQRWLELAQVHHPDKGGDAQKFDELRAAYERAMAIALTNADLPCPTCKGTTRVTHMHGFNRIDMPCPDCDDWNHK
jgi:DnaJ-class molecular chaperone